MAATAKAAHTITKFAKIIRLAVASWKMTKNIGKGVQKIADIAKIRKQLERIKNLGRKDKGDEPPRRLHHRPSPPGAPKNINGYETPKRADRRGVTAVWGYVRTL